MKEETNFIGQGRIAETDQRKLDALVSTLIEELQEEGLTKTHIYQVHDSLTFEIAAEEASKAVPLLNCIFPGLFSQIM